MTDTSIKDFEAAIAELETIVRKLEEGDLALEQSLALYERGVQLSRFCHARLEAAAKRIEILNDRGELKPAPSNLADERYRGCRDRNARRLSPARTRPRGRGAGSVSAAGARVSRDRGRRDALQRVCRRQAAAPDADARGRR